MTTILSDISRGKTRHQIRVIIPESTNEGGEKRQRKALPPNFPRFDYEAEPIFVLGQKEMPHREFCACVDGCSADSGCLCIGMSTHRLAKPGRLRDVDDLLGQNSSFDSAFFECTAGCACAGQCQNHLAPADAKQQRNQFEIFWKGGKLGFACRTLKPIRKGTFVCFLAGQVVSPEAESQSWIAPIEASDAEKACMKFQDETHQMGFKIRMDLIANESRFFNSSCCPNLVLLHVFRLWACNELPMVAFIARNEIEAGEELNFFYGQHWLLSKLTRKPKFHCRCQSLFCVWPAKWKHMMGKDEEEKDIDSRVRQIREKISKQDGLRAKERHLEKKRKSSGSKHVATTSNSKPCSSSSY